MKKQKRQQQQQQQTNQQGFRLKSQIVGDKKRMAASASKNQEVKNRGLCVTFLSSIWVLVRPFMSRKKKNTKKNTAAATKTHASHFNSLISAQKLILHNWTAAELRTLR